jgi:hypothetical protein
MLQSTPNPAGLVYTVRFDHSDDESDRHFDPVRLSPDELFVFQCGTAHDLLVLLMGDRSKEEALDWALFGPNGSLDRLPEHLERFEAITQAWEEHTGRSRESYWNRT